MSTSLASNKYPYHYYDALDIKLAQGQNEVGLDDGSFEYACSNVSSLVMS